MTETDGMQWKGAQEPDGRVADSMPMEASSQLEAGEGAGGGDA